MCVFPKALALSWEVTTLAGVGITPKQTPNGMGHDIICTYVNTKEDYTEPIGLLGNTHYLTTFFFIFMVPLPGLALVGEACGEEVEVHHALQAAQGGHTLNKIIIQPLP